MEILVWGTFHIIQDFAFIAKISPTRKLHQDLVLRNIGLYHENCNHMKHLSDTIAEFSLNKITQFTAAEISMKLI